MDPELVRRARHDEVEVSLSDLLGDCPATLAAELSGKVPNMLASELAVEGLQIYREKSGAWIITRLDD